MAPCGYRGNWRHSGRVPKYWSNEVLATRPPCVEGQTLVTRQKTVAKSRNSKAATQTEVVA